MFLLLSVVDSTLLGKDSTLLLNFFQDKHYLKEIRGIQDFFTMLVIGIELAI